MNRRLTAAAVTSLVALLALTVSMGPEAPLSPDPEGLRVGAEPASTSPLGRPLAPVSSTRARTPTATGDTVSPAIYLPGERLVRLTEPEALDRLASDHDLQILRRAGASGWAVLGGLSLIHI